MKKHAEYLIFAGTSEGRKLAEFLQEKGFVDMIVERRSMRSTLSHLLKLHGYDREQEAGGA